MKEGVNIKINKDSLKVAMARKQMNASDLATASGISCNTIYYWLSKESEPNTKSLGKIASALEIDVTEIIRED
jgi:transcriptional regulator with XRE-family HTH domain